MGVWGWIRQRLGWDAPSTAEDWDDLQAELGAGTATPAPARRAPSPPEPGSSSAEPSAKATKKAQRAAKRAAANADGPAADATGRKKKKRKKRRKQRGDARLTEGSIAPEVRGTPKPGTIQSAPAVAPLFAPPVFGEPDRAPPARRTPAPPPPRVSPPAPAPVVAEVPDAESETESDGEPRERRPPPDDMLTWVVLPKLEALLDNVDAALTDADATRDGLIALRKSFARDWAILRPVPADHRDRLEGEHADRLDALSARINSLPDPKAEEEAQIQAARLEVVLAAEALAAEADVDSALDQARLLRDIWRGAGRLPREQHRVLDQRWRSAMDAVYARREEQRAERLATRESLIARAELLAKSRDPIRAADAMKGLQAQWKAVGAVGRTEEGESTWQRFRTAGDQVFARRREARDAAETANLAAKEGLIAEVLALAGTEIDDPDDLQRRFHQRWKRIGHVPRAQSDALWERFRAACDRMAEPPDVDPAALGDGDDRLSHNPFSTLSRDD
jgi:hypothetical protein